MGIIPVTKSLSQDKSRCLEDDPFPVGAKGLFSGRYDVLFVSGSVCIHDGMSTNPSSQLVNEACPRASWFGLNGLSKVMRVHTYS